VRRSQNQLAHAAKKVLRYSLVKVIDADA